MIICKSPLRISLGGGGTDLPGYYREHEGFLIAGAICQYIYVSITLPFSEDISLKYSRQEMVKEVDEIRHPIIREAIRLFNENENKIEIVSLADIPAGTGLGSSGSFTTALLKALSLYYKKILTTEQIASLACRIEMEILGEPSGKQDQYIAAYGGITAFTFHKDESVSVETLDITRNTLAEMENRLLLYYTGISHASNILLKDQKNKSEKKDPAMLDNLHFTKELGYRSRKSLENGDLWNFGKIMHEHWEKKRKRSSGMSSERIDNIYKTGINNGAIGGKLIGAGGRGFMMFMAEDKNRLRNSMQELGLREVGIKFDHEGTRSMPI